MARFTFVLAALLGVALLAPLAIASSEISFDATLDATFTSFRGAHASGIIENGQSNFGSFDGTFERKILKKRSLVKGTAHLDFGNGDTLDFSFEVLRVSGRSFFSGTFTVTGGTGVFEDACGEGALFYDVASSPIPVEMIGNG